MEKEERFNLNELIKKQIEDCFNDNLMEALNAALIFKYVDTLQQQLKKQQEIINKIEKKIKRKYQNTKEIITLERNKKWNR